ncbi:MAG TPA: PIN domain-containing protein [Polyangiaceae bacterium]|nr:PIN domain-containing protein [Polyangiaceae bacterium]
MTRTTGFVFDTGMLIALERRKQRATHFFTIARRDRVPIWVPSPVFAEWWRGRSSVRESIRRSFEIDSLSEEVLRLAGEALANIKGKFDGCIVVDALVMASAALQGDTVFTGDADDLTRFHPFFPNVRVLGCGESPVRDQ